MMNRATPRPTVPPASSYQQPSAPAAWRSADWRGRSLERGRSARGTRGGSGGGGGGVPWWGWLAIAGGVMVILLAATLIIVMVVNVSTTVGEAVVKRVEDEQTLAEMEHTAMRMNRQMEDERTPASSMASEYDRYLARMEQQSAKVGGNDGKIARASVALMRAMQPDMLAYAAAQQRMMELDWNDHDTLNSKNDLDRLIAMLRDIQNTSNRFAATLKGLPERFARELENQGVPPEESERAMAGFKSGLRLELAIATQAHEAKICDLLARMFGLLRREWGYWEFDGRERTGIAFDNVIAERQYERIMDDLDNAAMQTITLQGDWSTEQDQVP